MKILIVENETMAVCNFLEATKEKKWTCEVFMVSGDDPGSEDERLRFLQKVYQQKPDAIVLDAALSDEEQKRLDTLSMKGGEVSEDSVSGYKYCRAITNERLGIPIIFLTKYGQGPVARTAMRVGANRVIMKSVLAGQVIREIEELIKAKTPHDGEFYWSMSQILSSRNDLWETNVMRVALNRFYLNDSSVRRFGLFTASLKGVLTNYFQGNIKCEKELMLNLVKSQVLLSLVDPRLRDHVRHTGNVFWLGYRLLHDIEEYVNPLTLPGCLPGIYDLTGPLSPKEQLLHSWTLASLFHDYGYVDEKKDKLTKLLTTFFPDVAIKERSVRDEASWDSNMEALRVFVEEIVGREHFLYEYLDTVVRYYGSEKLAKDPKSPKTLLIDHGFVSAHRLMNMIPLEKLDAQKKKVVLHAALAISFHNYVEITQKWRLKPQCEGKLLMGMFPICSLLAFADNVQTWDREMEVDPALHRTEAQEGLLERLVMSDSAYISGSEINEFRLKQKTGTEGYNLNIKVRYFVEPASDIEKVCENLRNEIGAWIQSNRLRQICDSAGFSSLLHGQIVYELPMLSGTLVAHF